MGTTEKWALSAFSAIKRGMSFEQIIECLGRPARQSRMGALALDYPLADGSRVEILFVHPQLLKLVHYRLDGTKMTWVPH